MKIYDCQMAPNPRRLRIFIKEKGLDIPLEEVDLLGGENLKPEYLAKNPQGLIPTLELDDGTLLTEVPAICRYLEAQHPEPNLMGANPLETAQIEAAERWAEMNGMASIAEVFRNAFEGLADRGMPGLTGIPQIPALVERGQKRFQAWVGQLDAKLAANEYVAGDRYSMADITTLCVCDFANAAGAPIHESTPNIKRWYESVSSRPGTQA